MKSVVIAAPSGYAAAIGAAVADSGGSAVDALIATTLTAMCSEPGVCAPGGGGFLTVWPAGDDPISIDGYMAMPGRDLPPDRPLNTYSVSMEYGGGITTEVGPDSIAVPGGFAAFAEAHRRWGRMPWAEVVGHVAIAMEQGFPLPESCHYYLGYSGESVFGTDPASRRALFDGDRLRGPGETVVVEGLASTLRRIAEEGAATMYTGDLGREIVADLAERGSRLTFADLAGYRPIVGAALQSDLDDWRLATTPPPAVGGVAVTAILRSVFDGADPLDPDRWAAAQRHVARLRREELEPATDREAAGWRALASFPGGGSGSTVNISVAGTDGAVAAATMSGGYGSGVIPTGTGLWMNNSLGERELNPGGLEATPIGARLLSNMAPTVAGRPGRHLAIGSPGADRITSALAISLTLLLTGHELAESIEHPRLHYELDRNTVAVEPGIELGPEYVERPFPGLNMYFGGATAAEWTPAGLSGHADSRRTGGVSFGGFDDTPDFTGS